MPWLNSLLAAENVTGCGFGLGCSCSSGSGFSCDGSFLLLLLLLVAVVVVVIVVVVVSETASYLFVQLMMDLATNSSKCMAMTILCDWGTGYPMFQQPMSDSVVMGKLDP